MSAEIKHSYAFGPYLLDPMRGVLMRGDTPVPLSQRSFEALLVLVQHSGAVVSKETLMTTLWPTTYVEEANLAQHISVLRKALGETPQDRRYIVTLSGKGYRFAEPVRIVPARGHIEELSGNLEAAGLRGEPTDVPPPSPVPPEPAGSSKFPSKRAIFSCAAGAAVLLLGLAYLLPKKHSAVLSQSDLVLVSDFVNTTGEAVFDGTLKQALRVELAESPYFNLVTDAQSRQTLELSGRSREEHILPPIALDLCQRVGAKVMIGGSIVRAGSEYILDLDSVNCLTAASLEHIETEVGSQDEVLTSLGRMIPSLRKKLGESVSSIQKFDVPILQATTKSLPALKAYTTGDELRAQGKDEESIPFYMLAIDLDPDFAVAYARLAAIYGDTAESELSAEYMKKSFERREHISEPEKLYIAAHYYDDVTRDTDKAIGIYELWTEIYPQDWIAFNNLATDYNKIGQPDKMLEAASRALALNAHHGLPYATLVQSYRVSSRFAEAKAVAAKAIAAKLDGYIVHFNLYMMAFAAADEPQMRTQIDWYHGKPLECWNLNHQALAAMSLGEVKRARALFELSRASALQHGMKEYAAATAIDEAQLESALGNSSQAKDKAGLALQISPDSTEAQAGGALAQSGDLNGAIALADAAARRSPQNLLLKKVNLAAVKAADDLNGNRPSAALEDLADALPYDFSSTGVVPEFITPYDRGQSYLRLGSGDKAAVEFQKIISHRGINPLSLYLTLPHLGLARAYTLTGDTGKSLAQYREFFGIWKDADPDVSVLAQAKAEYAREQSLHDGA